MKVLNRPDLEEIWKSTARCEEEKCETELEFSEEDLKLFHYFGTHFEHKYLSVECPICGSIVRGLKIPDYVIKRWEKKHPKAKSKFDGFDDRR